LSSFQKEAKALDLRVLMYETINPFFLVWPFDQKEAKAQSPVANIHAVVQRLEQLTYPY
jgi:hypothetical protein